MPFTKTIKTQKLVSPKSLILMGLPKVGKTKSYEDLQNEASKHGFDCELIELESGGADYVNGFVTDIKGGYKELQNHLVEIQKENERCAISGEKPPFKIAMVDSLTALEDMCKIQAYNDYISTPIGADALKKKPQNTTFDLIDGQAKWSYIRNRMKTWIEIFESLYDHVIFIGHIKDKHINMDSSEVSPTELMLSGKLSALTVSQVTATGVMYRDEKGVLRMTFANNARVVAGTRCNHLRGLDDVFSWNVIYPDLLP